MRTAAGLALVIVLAGCASPWVPTPPPLGPSESPPPTSPDRTPAPAPVEPAPSIPLLDPTALGLTCGDGLVFHPALLDQPGRAETDPDDAAAALRAELAVAASEALLPATGWVRVGQLADRVQFVAPGVEPEGAWSTVAFRRAGGTWQLDLAGECRLAPAAPAGTSIATWRLDPSVPPPAAADTTIRILINERSCASGRPPDGRILPASIVSSPDRVTIGILVRSLPGAQTCQGNPDFALEVVLPEPLGGRALLDGGTFPPSAPGDRG